MAKTGELNQEEATLVRAHVTSKAFRRIPPDVAEWVITQNLLASTQSVLGTDWFAKLKADAVGLGKIQEWDMTSNGLRSVVRDYFAWKAYRQ